MSHNPSNYQQNYQNYYPDINEQYDDYYEDEGQDFNYDDSQDLQVPNSRLYPEGYSDITELYARNALYAETQQRVENNDMQYIHDYDPEPNDYYYNLTQLHHRSRVPRAQCSTLQNTFNNYPYHHHHSLYTACPLANTAHYHPDDNSTLIPQKTGKTTGKTAKVIGIHSCGAASNLQNVKEYNVEPYHEIQGKKKVYHSRQNYEDYNGDGVRHEPVTEYKRNPELYMDYQEKKYCLYGTKVGKSGGMKKYPVTVKTAKYVSKNQMIPPLNKRPSALCLPVVTQPDPGLVKRKSKTHQVKKTYDQSEPLPQNPADIADNYPYAAHQMDSEGDMNSKSMAKGLEHLLDQYESDVVLNENQATMTNEEDGSGETKNKIREFAKFLKPRVPSSIKAKQEKIAKIKSSLNTSGSSLEPKMKISLDKLLNRLQKCEIVESTDKVSEKSYRSKKEEDGEKNKDDNDSKKRSFNYDTLSRKLSPTIQDKKQKEQNKSLLDKPSTSVTTSLDKNRSSNRMIALDDNCALDLHRSKSYIVDLIDRALSKELGTVPRGQSISHEMTRKQAVNTISRHRQSRHKELCYEVTAALTDSFISNATAPASHPRDVELKRSQSDDDEIKNKLCASFGDDVNYIKQLKQLRWGHIRHIQHEARKLADLEEFLEKCGEIEY